MAVFLSPPSLLQFSFFQVWLVATNLHPQCARKTSFTYFSVLILSQVSILLEAKAEISWFYDMYKLLWPVSFLSSSLKGVWRLEVVMCPWVSGGGVPVFSFLSLQVLTPGRLARSAPQDPWVGVCLGGAGPIYLFRGSFGCPTPAISRSLFISVKFPLAYHICMFRGIGYGISGELTTAGFLWKLPISLGSYRRKQMTDPIVLGYFLPLTTHERGRKFISVCPLTECMSSLL